MECLDLGFCSNSRAPCHLPIFPRDVGRCEQRSPTMLPSPKHQVKWAQTAPLIIWSTLAFCS